MHVCIVRVVCCTCVRVYVFTLVRVLHVSHVHPFVYVSESEHNHGVWTETHVTSLIYIAASMDDML